MVGAPDYGPGDWVVCIDATDAFGILVVGGKYLCEDIRQSSAISRSSLRPTGWDVKIFAAHPPVFTPCWIASRFRKLDPATDLPAMTKTSVPEVQS